MHSVKIEFCPLDWYSSSPTTIALHNKMYMCKVFPSNCKKLKKRKHDLHEISSTSPKARWSNFFTLAGHFSKLFKLADLSRLEIVPKS